MQNYIRRVRTKPTRVAYVFVAAALMCFATRCSANQTATTTPVVVDGALPYRMTLRTVPTGELALPTLHSYVRAEYENQWVLVAGRTNGLHGFTDDGLVNFPPASQNRDVWVIDVAAGQSWRRSLSPAESGLGQDVVDSLTPTNAQGVQIGDRLYMTGGYGFDATRGGFRTFDRLTAFDLPSLVDWVKQGTPNVADTFRQLQDSAFRVTGGAMTHANGRTHLVFGQEFDGGYDPISSGIYTEQIRSFSIVDDGENLAVENVVYGDIVEDYHRRDLSVVPVVRRGEPGELEQAWTALAGVFTLGDRAWTVPVKITADGEASMADPLAADTFKQGMNIYQTANLGMFSEQTGEMHTLLFGGITYQFYDRDAGQFVNDNQFPFTNQSTAVVVDADGNYRQILLDKEFPAITDESGKRLRFGANGEFFPSPGLPRYGNGVFKLDELTGETRLGYIFGGLMADAGNNGRTAGSNFLFEVVLTPVPEPGSLVLLTLAAACVVTRRMRRPTAK